jgi:EAL domain-containing protein (putative c-di-GMP-specific phosphodiesterase class I)
MVGFVLHKNKHKVDRKRKEAFLLWTFFWVMNLVFTFALPYCCYSSISSAFGVLIVFIFVENPEIMQGKHKEIMLYYYIGECLHFFKDNRPYLNIVGLRLSSPKEVEHFLKAFKKYKDDFFIFEDDTINFYVIFSNKGTYYPILQEYVAKNNLQSILFDEFYVDDTVKLSSFFKENIIKVPKGTIKVVKKEEFFKKEEELQIKEEIENALEENRVIAYVQPIYDVKKKKFTCGECLCRLKMRGGEIMLPYHFIGVAEKYGLICDIETAMFKNMCQILKQKDEIGVEYLEANLSIQKGESNTLYDEYVEIMESFGINGCHINLEITETDVLDEKNALLKNMDNLKKIGVKFSLDDFGTGESNLGYVIDMPVDIMKFDREIFQKAVAGNRARLVVKNVIDIAHDLGLKVVAEGVELETDVALCEEMNVDYIQGYYFSRPIPVDEFIAFCKQKNFAN